MTTALAKASRLRTLARAASQLRSPHRHFADDGFARMNIYKDASLGPKELDDKEYPDWLWRIQEVGATKEELLRDAQKHFAQGGFDAVFENMPEHELKRLFRLDQRDRIRMENNRRRGGRVV